jgi:hypothetical protein
MIRSYNTHGPPTTPSTSAAYRFYIRRMLSLSLNQEQQNNEWLHIQHVVRNNGVPYNLLLRLKRKIQQDLLHNTTISRPHNLQPRKNGRPSFTPHHRSGKSPIPFKHTDINIAFKFHNTIAQLSIPTRDTAPSSPYDKSGIYVISCVTCGKAYVWQTSRSLNPRFKEHTRYIRYNPLSAYALHILQHQHEYGPIGQTMTHLKPVTTTILWQHGKRLIPSKTQANRTHCSN